MTYADLLQCFMAYRDANRTRGPISDEEDRLLNELGDRFNAVSDKG